MGTGLPNPYPNGKNGINKVAMFITLTIIGLVVTLVGIPLHYLVVGARAKTSVGHPSSPGILTKLIYLVTLLSVVFLTATGFLPTFFIGHPLTGYPLVLHCIIAPVFVLGLVILALLWAGRSRFNNAPISPWAHKLFFWLIILLALPVTLSIALAMFPWYGTASQRFLLRLHQYSALFLVLFVMWHTYLLAVSRKT